MRPLLLIAFLLFSLPMAAKRAPKWKDGKFKTTATGLQYKIVKEGNGDSIVAADDVLVELYRYNPTDHLLIKDKADRKEGRLISLQDDKALQGIIQSVQLLKNGGKGYFIIPPLLAKEGSNDTLYCCIVIKNVFRNQRDVIMPGPLTVSIPVDSVKFAVSDPNKKYFGDTLIALMKLTEQPQMVNCGSSKVVIAFKFEMAYFENGMQHKNILVFIECPELYGKDYFISGSNYMVTCIPLLDDLKNGKRTMNSYSLEKLDRYYGLRVRRM
ncbi:MAG: hypothetical protein ABIQ40_17965 [Bacteroidia bacterium]